MENVLRLTYQCSRCQKTDTLKLFPEEHIPQTFNCWNCQAGRGKEINEMLMTNMGMFLVQNDEQAVTA